MESSRDAVKYCDFGYDYSLGAKLLVENECSALLEDLHLELEEERNAAASAANETMSMILRLQREKSEIQMEARQFKAFAEETMMHEQEKVSALEELVYEKDQAIEALSYEVEAYKQMLISYEITEHQIDSSTVGIVDYSCEYTSLEKVMVGSSPRWPYYDPNSHLVDSPMSSSSDRVYTIDSVHVGVSEVKIEEEPSEMSKRYQEPVMMTQQGVKEPDIEKLYTRLQALEADRESLRQVIVAMQADKAQLELLKEIAQKLSKETVTTDRRKSVISIMPSFKAFSVRTVFKWIVSFVSWRRKAKQNKYVYHMSANNMGMLMILGEGSRTRRWTCLASSHV